MTVAGVSFESLVENSWSLAVFEAAHRFREFRQSVLAALASPNSEVRSAAVAVLNEANDRSAHDQIASLLTDPDSGVRGEVLEYLVEFSVEKDARALVNILKEKQQLFLVSSALKRLYPQGPEMHEDDSASSQDANISEWEAILGTR